MPVNQPNDFAVARRQLNGGDGGGAFVTGKAGWHPGSLADVRGAGKTVEFAVWGKSGEVAPKA